MLTADYHVEHVENEKIQAEEAMFLAAVLWFFISLAWASEKHAVPAAEATAVRIAHHGDHTRFVVDLSEKLSESETVSLTQPTDIPSKNIVVNLGNVTWSLPRLSETGVGVIRQYRYHDAVPAQIVLEMTRPAVVTKTLMLSPNQQHSWRLVVDLAENNQRVPGGGSIGGAQRLRRDWSSIPSRVSPGNTAFLFSQRSDLESIPLPPRPPVSLQKEYKPKIVIDPGHGGADPGATGVSGIFEKHITLAMALELREKLLSTKRYSVLLTREKDTFVALRERVASARTHNADLFISIHADAIATSEICGLSVYTLSEEASDQEAAALAERENRADLIGGVDLSREPRDVANILIDLVQRETINHSAQLASAFTRELRREIRLLPKTHRFAGFAVLKAPDVPAILLEMGYLSNPQEEQLLHQPAYRAQLSAAMVRAIDDYFSHR